MDDILNLGEEFIRYNILYNFYSNALISKNFPEVQEWSEDEWDKWRSDYERARKKWDEDEAKKKAEGE